MSRRLQYQEKKRRWHNEGRCSGRRAAQEHKRTSTSLAHMATRSMPIVSCLPTAWAIFSLVPTPSVPDTSTGSVKPAAARSKSPGREDSRVNTQENGTLARRKWSRTVSVP